MLRLVQQGGSRAGRRGRCGASRRQQRGAGRGEGGPEEPAEGDGAGAGADQAAAGGGRVQDPGAVHFHCSCQALSDEIALRPRRVCAVHDCVLRVTDLDDTNTLNSDILELLYHLAPLFKMT